MKTLKIPKIGTVVAVRWEDSGMMVNRCDDHPEERQLPYFTTIGKIASITCNHIVLLNEWEDGGRTNFSDNTIARNCIANITSYKEL